MAESQAQTDELLESIDARAVLLDEREDELNDFVSEALESIRAQLDSNREAALKMGGDANMSVSEVMDRVDHVQVRAQPFENPRITLWISGKIPVWANDAWDDTIYPRGINAYNGKVRVVFDVRPL